MTAKDKLSGYGLFFTIWALSYAALFLLQLWNPTFDMALFVKISITYAVVGGVAIALFLIRREFGTNDTLKDKNYLD